MDEGPGSAWPLCRRVCPALGIGLRGSRPFCLCSLQGDPNSASLGPSPSGHSVGGPCLWPLSSLDRPHLQGLVTAGATDACCPSSHQNVSSVEPGSLLGCAPAPCPHVHGPPRAPLHSAPRATSLRQSLQDGPLGRSWVGWGWPLGSPLRSGSPRRGPGTEHGLQPVTHSGTLPGCAQRLRARLLEKGAERGEGTPGIWTKPPPHP